jgi:lipoprotein-anchoring transpeptidase ErfK/SrfK
LSLPQGKSRLFTKIAPADFQFTTIAFPEITKASPTDGAGDVSTGIEDPITLDFNRPLDNFFVKADLSPSTGVTYQSNDARTEFKLLPSDGIKYGTDYDMKVYVKYADDSDSNYHQIYESSFSTTAPPVITWDKNYTTRIEQAKKYTAAKITTGKYIDINLEAQVMTTFEDGKLLNSYMVSSGKPSMPTHKGQFSIHNKSPRAYSKEFGLYMPWWMAVAPDGSFGIHELPEWPSGYKEGAAHLGTPVSHGCIRLGVGPAKTVYDWAEIGTPVVIY